MAKITSKRQLTIPKAIADQYRLESGDEVQFEPAGEAIRLVPKRRGRELTVAERLAIFDRSVKRQRERERHRQLPPASDRGWRREDLYDRGSPD